MVPTYLWTLHTASRLSTVLPALCGLYLYHTAPPPTLRPRLQGEYTSTNRSYSPSSNFGETDVHSVLHGEEDEEDGGLDLGSGPAVI